MFLTIQEDLIARYGGSQGVRDRGLLEAALFRPQTGYYADLIAEAAALWESLSQNHAFVDRNKRLAFAATYAFLGINGMTIVADPLDAYAFIVELHESNSFRFEMLDPWLRSNTQLSDKVAEADE